MSSFHPAFKSPVLHGFRLRHGHLRLLDGLRLGQTAHAAVLEAFALDLGRTGGIPMVIMWGFPQMGNPKMDGL